MCTIYSFNLKGYSWSSFSCDEIKSIHRGLKTGTLISTTRRRHLFQSTTSKAKPKRSHSNENQRQSGMGFHLPPFFCSRLSSRPSLVSCLVRSRESQACELVRGSDTRTRTLGCWLPSNRRAGFIKYVDIKRTRAWLVWKTRLPRSKLWELIAEEI